MALWWFLPHHFCNTLCLDCQTQNYERNSDIPGLEEVLFGIMYVFSFLPNLHVILMEEFVHMVPWNFNARVSKRYVLLWSDSWFNSCSGYSFYFSFFFICCLDCATCLYILSFSSSSNELFLQQFVTSLVKQKTVLKVGN